MDDLDGARTGVHCSVRHGFHTAAEDAHALGCDTLQMFTQSPSEWMTKIYTNEDFERFKQVREKYKLNPIVLHSPYLPNLCTSNGDLYKKSLNALKTDLVMTHQLGAEYLVLHPGSYSPNATPEIGFRHFIVALNEALDSSPGSFRVLIENMAGGGRRLAGKFSEINGMISGIKHQNRMGVCIDTCHTFAAGYDIRNEDGVEIVLDEFEKEIGLDKVFVFHVNDSKGELACHRDIHQNLGQGNVGTEGLTALFRSVKRRRKTLKGLAFILETPKQPIPKADVENIKILRSCLSQSLTPR